MTNLLAACYPCLEAANTGESVDRHSLHIPYFTSKTLRLREHVRGERRVCVLLVVLAANERHILRGVTNRAHTHTVEVGAHDQN